MAQASVEAINKENQKPSSSDHQSMDSGFSFATESEHQDTMTHVTMESLYESKEDSLNDDEDDWCTFEDTKTADEDAPEPMTLDIILEILSAANCPDDIDSNHHKNLREEVLSHEIILRRTWIQVTRECTEAVMVCIICFLCTYSDNVCHHNINRWTLNLIWRRHSSLLTVESR